MKATPTPAAGRAKARCALVEAAGAYLRNPVREPGVTCRMCAAPVDGFEFCWCCQQHRAISGIADLVVPLTYAINGSESAALVRDYKNHPVRSVRQAHSHVIGSLVELAVSTHERCVAAVVGSPVSTRVVVPSLTSRPGLHPLAQIAARMNLLGPAELVVDLDARCDRAVCADKFAVRPLSAVVGKHVLVIDDVWTTGCNAQSAALMLRRAGAAAVTVMVVGRWLNPCYGANAEFIGVRLKQNFDLRVCPATGNQCP